MLKSSSFVKNLGAYLIVLDLRAFPKNESRLCNRTGSGSVLVTVLSMSCSLSERQQRFDFLGSIAVAVCLWVGV